MTTIKLPFIDKFKDRHGTLRYYFRRQRGDKRIPLPSPAEPGFMAAYDAAKEGRTPGEAPKRPRGAPGTWDALLELFFRIGMLNLAPSSRKLYRGLLERVVRDEGWGHRPIRGMRKEHVLTMLSKRTDRPGHANMTLKVVRIALRFAADQQPPWIEHDPTLRVKGFKGGEYRSWIEAEIAQFHGDWARGTKERTAFDLLLYTGQRVSDTCRMSWADDSDEDGGIWVVQQKTGTKLLIPKHPDLQATLKAWRRTLKAQKRTHLAIVPTYKGTPFTAGSFSEMLATASDHAGIPSDAVRHGLRKAASRRLAEAGCSSKEIAAITGHKSLREIERYVKEAEQKGLARSAMAKLRKFKPGTPDSQPLVNYSQPRGK